MNRNVLLAALVLCLAVFGSLPARAEQPDPLDQLFKEGWVQVSPGVLQRDLGPGKVETLGFGADGLRWKLRDLRKHLDYLQTEFARKPSNDLRKGIRNQRAEINRVLKALRTAKAVDDLSSATEAASAGIDCTIRYGAHVNAFYTTNAQGVNATSDSYFNSNCGQVGEVYATSHGKARGTNGILYTQTKHDPPLGQIRSGVNVTANGSITPVYGVSECYSYSYASMTSYDLGIVYAQSVDNTVCPPPVLNLPAITSNYGNSVHIYGYNCAIVSWTAYPSGGTTPYTYSWTANASTTIVGTGQTYSRTFCGSNFTTTGTWTANVTARDSSSPQQSRSSSHTLTIYYHYDGGGGCLQSATVGDGTTELLPCPDPQ